MKKIYSMIAMLMLAPVTHGQMNIADEVPQAIELMKHKKWSDAQVQLQNIVQKLGDRGEALFREKFGVIFYYKGYCEIQLAKASGDVAKKNEYFKLASESMKECFEIHMRMEKMHSKSLLYRAQAEQGLGNMATAIELNKLFIAAQKE